MGAVPARLLQAPAQTLVLQRALWSEIHSEEKAKQGQVEKLTGTLGGPGLGVQVVRSVGEKGPP